MDKYFASRGTCCRNALAVLIWTHLNTVGLARHQNENSRESVAPVKSAEEEEIDRLLGDRALFDVGDPQKFGGPSPQVLYRARRAGMIETVEMGGLTKLSRATMKRLLLKGLARVPLYYPGMKSKSAKSA